LARAPPAGAGRTLEGREHPGEFREVVHAARGPGARVVAQRSVGVAYTTREPDRLHPHRGCAGDVGCEVVAHVHGFGGAHSESPERLVEDLLARFSNPDLFRYDDRVKMRREPRLLDHAHRRRSVREVRADAEFKPGVQAREERDVVIEYAHAPNQLVHVDPRQELRKLRRLKRETLDEQLKALACRDLAALGVHHSVYFRIHRSQDLGERLEGERGVEVAAQGLVEKGIGRVHATSAQLNLGKSVHVQVDEGVEQIEEDGLERHRHGP